RRPGTDRHHPGQARRRSGRVRARATPRPAARPRDLCLHCLEEEPHRRYPSAQELADDLHRFLAGEPILTRPTPPGERAWKWACCRPTVAALAAALTGSALLDFALVAWQWRRAQFGPGAGRRRGGGAALAGGLAGARRTAAAG